MAEKVIYSFSNIDLETAMLGPMNKNIKIIEQTLKCHIVVTQSDIIGDEIYEEVLKKIFKIIELLINKGQTVKERELLSIIAMIQNYPMSEVEAFFNKQVVFVNTYDGRTISAKTLNQKYYFDALQNNDIVFASGAAGSGKTYLTVAYALNQLKKNKIKKIIITRPVVEAGEKLGFLPGDLKEKIDPYLIPIYDAINDIIGLDSSTKLLEKGIIEIAPLAYMRGRTLDNAFIILDEAQNTTKNQMKMFLTRLGFNSKMVITGDISQIDLPGREQSGLIHALSILDNVPGIKKINFTQIDVMRHPLVSKIISRYEGDNND